MALSVSKSLLQKYDRAGPRYTSYPTVPVWSAAFGEAQYRGALARLAARSERDLCLYVHMPFCAKRCHYCGCNAMAGCGADTTDRYLDHLEQELDLLLAAGRAPEHSSGRGIQSGDLAGRASEAGTSRPGTGLSGRRVVQIHWGGGTPNFLGVEQVARTMRMLRTAFAVTGDAEISLETDPRLGTPEQAIMLREVGFNRVSLGVQDFDENVQKAIGRRQSEERTRRFFKACRDAGFHSVNLDLVYGLPGQTPESFARTLAVVLEYDPDRVACFGYAHVPWVKSNQQLVDTTRMPSPEQKFALFQQAIETFTGAGYVWVGMDHFARPQDELACAQRERRLHRNFMGYTVRPAADLLALGMSSISELDDCFAQNSADLDVYQQRVAAGHLPIVRGHLLSQDDGLRRRAITHLMCNLELPYDLTLPSFGVRLDEELATALEHMEPLVEDGFLAREPDRLRVTGVGRFFIRNICMELDAYLKSEASPPVFSRTI
jgi:oxygen-independent coproporphyrinogen-3 oxidase